MSVRDGMAIYPYHSFPSIPFPREKERLRRKFFLNNFKKPHILVFFNVFLFLFLFFVPLINK